MTFHTDITADGPWHSMTVYFQADVGHKENEAQRRKSRVLAPDRLYRPAPGDGSGVLHHDGLSRVTLATDARGAPSTTYSYAYDAAGSLVRQDDPGGATVPNPFEYAGGYHDASTGLTKFGERYYDPAVGRWTQRDPSGLDANAYLYVGANPVNYTDPSGLFGFDDVKKGFGYLADYATGEDSERRARDPNYNNPISNAEDAAADYIRDNAFELAGAAGTRRVSNMGRKWLLPQPL